MPKGYIYAEFEVTDAGAWEKYVTLSQASLAGLGARNVFGGGDPGVLEGDLGGRRISILEFESPEERADGIILLKIRQPRRRGLRRPS
jgi:uncharacterized protein (DUF1330 family)